ncbi:MAG: hypothetical protein IJZ21_01985 [Clostridia bacterium]|nr:hypothetical protein [Clostridia bacterium]
MKMQRFYNKYCIVVWSMWIVFMLSSIISEELLPEYSLLLSAIPTLLLLPSLLTAILPIQPILASVSLAFSIQNKNTKYVVFDILSFLISALLAAGEFLIYILYYAPSH